MTDARFREVFNRIERRIEERYGLPVVITDVPDPFTGDLDGASILVDYDLDQWLANCAACDIAYLMHFYRTSEKRPFREFWSESAALLEPLPIPPFRRKRGSPAAER